MMVFMLIDIGVALLVLGLGIAGVFGSSNVPFEATGWLALIFALLCWYVATAQLVNATYGKAILPIW